MEQWSIMQDLEIEYDMNLKAWNTICIGTWTSKQV